jgi:hypothetical protein
MVQLSEHTSPLNAIESVYKQQCIRLTHAMVVARVLGEQLLDAGGVSTAAALARCAAASTSSSPTTTAEAAPASPTTSTCASTTSTAATEAATAAPSTSAPATRSALAHLACVQGGRILLKVTLK